MLFQWFRRPRVEVQVTVLGLVGPAMVSFHGQVRLHEPVDVALVLKAAGKAARADLLGALQRGAEPAILLDGRRLELPDGLKRKVRHGASVSWLMPLAGG